MKAIKDDSGGAICFGEGCIYPLLHKLEARRDLSSRRVSVGGRSRVVYRVTQAGCRRLAHTSDQWAKTIEAVSHILQGGECGQTGVAR